LSQSTKLLIGGGVLVVLLSALIVGSLGSEDPDADNALAYGEVTVTGDPLPFMADPAGDVAPGMPAPALEGVDYEGNPVKIEPGGEPMVIAFLAHWCPHCQADVPRVQRWLDETGGNPAVEFYSVATSSDRLRPNFPPGEWLQREGWTPPVLLDDQRNTAGVTYGVSAYPFWVVVDSEGNVAARLSGELDRAGVEQLFAAAADL